MKPGAEVTTEELKKGDLFTHDDPLRIDTPALASIWRVTDPGICRDAVTVYPFNYIAIGDSLPKYRVTESQLALVKALVT